jgi:hypothetical protein
MTLASPREWRSKRATNSQVGDNSANGLNGGKQPYVVDYVAVIDYAIFNR